MPYFENYKALSRITGIDVSNLTIASTTDPTFTLGVVSSDKGEIIVPLSDGNDITLVRKTDNDEKNTFSFNKTTGDLSINVLGVKHTFTKAHMTTDGDQAIANLGDTTNALNATPFQLKTTAIDTVKNNNFFYEETEKSSVLDKMITPFVTGLVVVILHVFLNGSSNDPADDFAVDSITELNSEQDSIIANC